MHTAHPDWSSHIPVLIKAVEQTTGPVLELGTGISSTPLLHMLCFDQDRELVSYDHSGTFVHMFRKFRSDKHKVELVVNWDDISDYIKSVHWGVVFVDHGPHERRIIETALVANNADLVVMHDTQDPAYDYDKVYPLFKYRFDYKKQKNHTTVLSNKQEFVWRP